MIPSENPDGLGQRQLVTKIIEIFWNNLQKWAEFWKYGSAELKKLIPLIMEMNRGHDCIYDIQIISKEINQSIKNMVSNLLDIYHFFLRRCL